MGLKTGYWNSVDALNSAQAHSWGWSGAACDQASMASRSS